ncbi:MAG: PH domain-containing protein [Oscillospiraceae bacterium]|nr:PH domain-containing protein [Oscillospiraceae bacterium]
MDFLLYFVLRRIFLRTELSPGNIVVTKGLLLRRRCEIPFAAVTKIEIRRTLVLRLLRGKRVEISTLSGGVFFYMRNNERLPFLPDYDGIHIKAGAFQSIAGAFVDTRALSGVITFGLFLNRIGGVFGSESFDRIMSAMLGAAEGLSQTLGALHIGVPRITALAAVFVGAAWLFVFFRKALGMLRFRLSCESGFITIQRGVFTLYECRLVRNNLTACLRCDTLTTLLLRSAPLYCHDVMLFPPVSRRTADRILSKMCRLPLPQEGRIKPPFSAIFGHSAVPLGWLAGFAAALALTFIAEPIGADLVQSLLWSGVVISLWFTVTYAIYMRMSGASRERGMTGLAFRRGARLYTAVIPDVKIPMKKIGRNIFQKFSGMCDITLAVAGRRRYKLRNVPHRDIERLFRG